MIETNLLGAIVATDPDPAHRAGALSAPPEQGET
jgi:hypothetical protein